MLRGVDTLVYDIQDAGARFYTYSCTMCTRGGSRQDAHPDLHSGPAESDYGAFTWKGRCSTTICKASWLLCDADSPRPDTRRTGNDGKHRTRVRAELHIIKMKDWSRGRLVRFHGVGVDRSLAEYAQPERRDALRRPGDARSVEELFGRPWHGQSVRADRRGLDSTEWNSRIPECAIDSRRASFIPRAFNRTRQISRENRLKVCASSFSIASCSARCDWAWRLPMRFRALSGEDRFRGVPVSDRQSQSDRRDEKRGRSADYRAGPGRERAVVVDRRRAFLLYQ